MIFKQISPGISVAWNSFGFGQEENMGSASPMTFFNQLKLPTRNVSRAGRINHMALRFAALIPGFNRRFEFLHFML
jgi:hypothetical protein